jgi:hypothetical protein
MEGIRFNWSKELGYPRQQLLTPEEREKRACEELAAKMGLDSGLNIVATPRAAMNAEDALMELRDKLCLG